MKILRVIHGLSNNMLDMEVADQFSIDAYRKTVIADGGIVLNGAFSGWIPLQWVQHVVLLTPEAATAAMMPEGATKQ